MRALEREKFKIKFLEEDGQKGRENFMKAQLREYNKKFLIAKKEATKRRRNSITTSAVCQDNEVTRINQREQQDNDYGQAAPHHLTLPHIQTDRSRRQAHSMMSQYDTRTPMLNIASPNHIQSGVSLLPQEKPPGHLEYINKITKTAATNEKLIKPRLSPERKIFDKMKPKPLEDKEIQEII